MVHNPNKEQIGNQPPRKLGVLQLAAQMLDKPARHRCKTTKRINTTC